MRPRVSEAACSPRTTAWNSRHERLVVARRNASRGKRSKASFARQETISSGANVAAKRSAYGSSPPPARIVSAASRPLTNASYMPSPESGSTSPAASPTSRTRPWAGRRQAERARRDPVRAVGADDDVGRDAFAVERHRARGVDRRDLGAVAKLRARGRRLLDEEGVEAAPLGHQDERLRCAAAPAARVAEPELQSVDPVFDHRLDRDGQLFDGAEREAAAAGFVARKPGAGDQAHARARARAAIRSRRACRPAAH